LAQSSRITTAEIAVGGPTFLLGPGDCSAAEAGVKLGDLYQERSLPVAKRRLYQAGVRLAWALDDALRPE